MMVLQRKSMRYFFILLTVCLVVLSVVFIGVGGLAGLVSFVLTQTSYEVQGLQIPTISSVRCIHLAREDELNRWEINDLVLDVDWKTNTILNLEIGQLVIQKKDQLQLDPNEIEKLKKISINDLALLAERSLSESSTPLRILRLHIKNIRMKPSAQSHWIEKGHLWVDDLQIAPHKFLVNKIELEAGPINFYFVKKSDVNPKGNN